MSFEEDDDEHCGACHNEPEEYAYQCPCQNMNHCCCEQCDRDYSLLDEIMGQELNDGAGDR